MQKITDIFYYLKEDIRSPLAVGELFFYSERPVKMHGFRFNGAFVGQKYQKKVKNKRFQIRSVTCTSHELT